MSHYLRTGVSLTGGLPLGLVESFSKLRSGLSFPRNIALVKWRIGFASHGGHNESSEKERRE